MEKCGSLSGVITRSSSIDSTDFDDWVKIENENREKVDQTARVTLAASNCPKEEAPNIKIVLPIPYYPCENKDSTGVSGSSSVKIPETKGAEYKEELLKETSLSVSSKVSALHNSRTSSPKSDQKINGDTSKSKDEAPNIRIVLPIPYYPCENKDSTGVSGSSSVKIPETKGAEYKEEVLKETSLSVSSKVSALHNSRTSSPKSDQKINDDTSKSKDEAPNIRLVLPIPDYRSEKKDSTGVSGSSSDSEKSPVANNPEYKEEVLKGASSETRVLPSKDIKRRGPSFGLQQLLPVQGKSEIRPKKDWHRRTPPKPSNIEYDFPKIEALARENPSALISQFFKDAKRLEEIDPAQLQEKQRVQARMRRVQDLAISHIRTMNHGEISEFLASPLFSSTTEAQAVEYPLKHALLAEFSVRQERDYKALQESLLRNGKPLNMIVFKQNIPTPPELQEMGRALGKDHVKVVGIDSNPTITHFPKSLRALGDIKEIRVSDSPSLTNPSVPKELSFLKSVTLNGRSYSLK